MLASPGAFTTSIVETLRCEEQDARIDALVVWGLKSLLAGDIGIAERCWRGDVSWFWQAWSKQKICFVSVVGDVGTAVCSS